MTNASAALAKENRELDEALGNQLRAAATAGGELARLHAALALLLRVASTQSFQGQTDSTSSTFWSRGTGFSSDFDQSRDGVDLELLAERQQLLARALAGVRAAVRAASAPAASAALGGEARELLRSLLATDSLLEVFQRQAVFVEVFGLVGDLVENEGTRGAVFAGGDQSLYRALRDSPLPRAAREMTKFEVEEEEARLVREIIELERRMKEVAPDGMKKKRRKVKKKEKRKKKKEKKEKKEGKEEEAAAAAAVVVGVDGTITPSERTQEEEDDDAGDDDGEDGEKKEKRSGKEKGKEKEVPVEERERRSIAEMKSFLDERKVDRSLILERGELEEAFREAKEAEAQRQQRRDEESDDESYVTTVEEYSSSVAGDDGDATAAGAPTFEGVGGSYVEDLAPYRVVSRAISGKSFEFFEQSLGDPPPTSKKILRLVSEVESLRTSLPLAPQSSAFLVVDEQRIDVMKCLISGPMGTPYAGGLFEFDIYFPRDYPRVPPLVHLVTTGHGSVRFNPNLYNNGKVCLSLLGTWSGPKEEQWTEQSTLLQVIVSIQALVFIEDPWFNEPTMEVDRGNARGDELSVQYNATLREECVCWAMVHQLEAAEESLFREVIYAHFLHRGEELVQMARTWLQEPEYASRYTKLEHFVEKFSQMVANLQEIFPQKKGK